MVFMYLRSNSDVPFGWGHIQDHGDDDERWWGSFYYEDYGECGHCDSTNVPIAAMYDNGSNDGSNWVCLPCYLKHHKDQCGCDLWKEAENKYECK